MAPLADVASATAAAIMEGTVRGGASRHVAAAVAAAVARVILYGDRAAHEDEEGLAIVKVPEEVVKDVPVLAHALAAQRLTSELVGLPAHNGGIAARMLRARDPQLGRDARILNRIANVVKHGAARAGKPRDRAARHDPVFDNDPWSKASVSSGEPLQCKTSGKQAWALFTPASKRCSSWSGGLEPREEAQFDDASLAGSAATSSTAITSSAFSGDLVSKAPELVEALVREIYARRNPAKIPEVGALFGKYGSGLYQLVCEKYGEQPLTEIVELIKTSSPPPNHGVQGSAATAITASLGISGGARPRCGTLEACGNDAMRASRS